MCELHDYYTTADKLVLSNVQKKKKVVNHFSVVICKIRDWRLVDGDGDTTILNINCIKFKLKNTGLICASSYNNGTVQHILWIHFSTTHDEKWAFFWHPINVAHLWTHFLVVHDYFCKVQLKQHSIVQFCIFYTVGHQLNMTNVY